MATKLWGLALLLLTQPAFGQLDPKENGVFRLFTPSGAQGTAFVVAEPKDGVKILATAAHVPQYTDANGKDVANQIWGGKPYYLTSDFGPRVEGVACVSIDFEADIALMLVDLEMDFTILQISDCEVAQPVLPSPDYMPARKPVSFYGYASGEWAQTIGWLAFTHKQNTYSDGACLPGQSGGPMLYEGKYVGVVSGGTAWYPYTKDGKQKNATWPARCGRGRRLKEILDAYIKANYTQGATK